MTKASSDEFEIINDCQVKHRPTGAEFSTYRYDEPSVENIAAGGMKVNWRDAGHRLPSGADYEREDVQLVAVELLAELGRQREAAKKKD